MRFQRCLAIAASLIASGVFVAAQQPCASDKHNSIAVSIAVKQDDVHLPGIALTVKNLGARVLSDEDIDGGLSPRVHLEGKHGEASKTTWYRRRVLEYGYSPLDGSRMASPQEFAPGESIVRAWVLEGLYYIDEPGKYSVYMEVHDPVERCDLNARWLRTNTVQFEISPKQVQTFLAKVVPPKVSATIKMQQEKLVLGQPPTIAITVWNHGDDYNGDDFFPHVEGKDGELSKTMYHRQRRHEPGTKEFNLFEGPKPDYPRTRERNNIRADQSESWEIDLRNFYNFDTPGKYTVYVEFPDTSGKMLRTNTVEFEITAPKQ